MCNQADWITARISEKLPQARKEKIFANVDVNLKFNKPELDLTIDRMRAKDLGLSTSDISQALQSAFSGARSAYFIMNDRLLSYTSHQSLDAQRGQYL